MVIAASSDGDAEYIEDHRHDLIPAARIARSLVSNEGFQRDRASNASGGHASELLSLMGRLAKNRLTLGPIAGSVLSSLISGQSLRVQEASSGRGNSTEDLLSLFVRIANHGRDAVNLLDSLSGQGQTAEPVASDCREPEHSDPHEDEEGTPNDGRVHGKVTAAKLERELRITQEVCKKMGIPVPQELRDKMGLPVARLDRNGGIVRDVLERTRLVPSDEEGSNSIAEDRGGQEDRNVKADSLAVATHTIAAVHDIALSIKEAMINEGEDD